MATTTGRVQRFVVIPGSGSTSTACFSVGDTPSNSELFFIQRKDSDSEPLGAFKNSMVDALSTALVGRHPVVVTHGASDAEITQLRVEA